MSDTSVASPPDTHRQKVARRSPAPIRMTEAPLAIVLDAIAHAKPTAVDSTRRYLDTLASTFDQFALDEPASGVLDKKVLDAIGKFLPSLDEYRRLIAALAGQPDDASTVAPVTQFLNAILSVREPGGESADQCYLWTDANRFLLRELFLSTVSIFVHQKQFAKAAIVLDTRYAGGSESSNEGRSFVAFDAYVKTLDEFRNRRLQLNRMSVCSDLLRERADDDLCPFAVMMQVDFVLCLRSLLCEQEFFARWYPRTLVFAQPYTRTGLDLFAATARFDGLACLLRVRDRAEMIERFEEIYEAWNLERWELAGAQLDFRGYMAMKNPVLSN